MASQVLVVHERIGTWARHLRPRLTGWPVRVSETRSGADLVSALSGTVCPVVLIDVARRPRPALEDLDRALTVAPGALVLVLNPVPIDGVSTLARELGATHVISGPSPPPAVAGLLARWIPLAQKRTEAAGRACSTPPPPEIAPWDWPLAWPRPRPDAAWAPRERP